MCQSVIIKCFYHDGEERKQKINFDYFCLEISRGRLHFANSIMFDFLLLLFVCTFSRSLNAMCGIILCVSVLDSFFLFIVELNGK